ncbi:hypothetical protein QE152_g6771 [Popillia japonica]|uniref:Uncharacterized protein n=1 Tax=Popillia japonica TaxID=7064 RepID=A0AAW1MFP1_POPJA
MSKKWDDTRPLTERELEELLPGESDVEEGSSGSEVEDNLEKDFSPSESVYELSDDSGTDSDESGPFCSTSKTPKCYTKANL